MNIFQKLKSKLSPFKSKPDLNEDQKLHFYSGSNLIQTTALNENIISIDIDPEYSGRLANNMIELETITTALAYSGTRTWEEFNYLLDRLHNIKQNHILIIEEITIRYFSEYMHEIKNPYGIAVNTAANRAFFLNKEKQLNFQ